MSDDRRVITTVLDLHGKGIENAIDLAVSQQWFARLLSCLTDSRDL